MRSIRSRTLLAGCIAIFVLAACGDKNENKGKQASQTAARVNSAEITVHQINQVLARAQGITQETAPQARQEVLNRLIDQQLAIEQAQDKKLDRQPEVMAVLEAARRDVLAKAYLDHVIAAQAKPTPEEGKKYYADHPNLFAQRRVYNLQEIAVEKNDALLPALRDKLATTKSFDDVLQWLKDKGVKFAGKGGVRPAEQLPLELLNILHPMKDGQAIVMNNPQGTTIIRILASQTVPVDETTAMPRIQQFLANQRAKEVVEKEMKQLREKARIEYVGNFAPAPDAKATAQPAATASAAPAEPPAAATPGLGDVGKAVGALK